MVAMTAEPEQLDKLAYSATEVAALLGIGVASVYAGVAKGDVRAVRVGGRIVITAGELRRLLGLEGGVPTADGRSPCPED